MSIEEGEGEGLYFDTYDQNKITYSDTQDSFSGHIRDKLTEDAVIHLDGCNTASEGLLYHLGFFNDNIAMQLSKELPGVTVGGNVFFGVGNEPSNPDNRNQYFRVGRETHILGYRRNYNTRD